MQPDNNDPLFRELYYIWRHCPQIRTELTVRGYIRLIIQNTIEPFIQMYRLKVPRPIGFALLSAACCFFILGFVPQHPMMVPAVIGGGIGISLIINVIAL